MPAPALRASKSPYFFDRGEHVALVAGYVRCAVDDSHWDGGGGDSGGRDSELDDACLRVDVPFLVEDKVAQAVVDGFSTVGLN